MSLRNRANLHFPIRNAITKLDGLAAYWPGNSLVDPRLDHRLTNAGNGATPVAGVLGGAWNFDGVDDRLVQPSAATNIGNLAISYAAGYAWFSDDGQDFSPYVRGSAGSDWMLAAIDIAGLKSYGYIGDIGTGETLDSNICVNGTFAAVTGDNPNSWNIIGTEDAGSYINASSGACQIVSDGDSMGVNQSVLTAGRRYKITYSVKSAISGTIRIGTNAAVTDGVTDGAVGNAKTFYVTAQSVVLYIIRNGVCNITIDDIVVEQVLTPPATGVVLYSTKTGTTQNYIRTSAGFDSKNISSYIIVNTKLNFTSIFSAGIWIKGTAQQLRAVFGKFDSVASARSWVIITGEADNTKINAYLSSDGTSSNRKYYQSSITVLDSTWHLVGFSWSAGTLKLFVDGIEDVNATKTADTAITSVIDGIRISVGASDNESGILPFSGQTKDAFIFNRDLSASEWEQIYSDMKWGLKS